MSQSSDSIRLVASIEGTTFVHAFAQQWGLFAVALAATSLFALLASKWVRAIERAGLRLARRRGAAVLVVGVLALAGRALILPVLPIPNPRASDEFSYLLAADTFGSGRVANPTHPMWVHFETIHVNQQPTYGSMYPPAPGLVMGLAQAATGEPWIGVWLSVGLACAAICWMLQGWLPPGWALLGGLIAVMRFALFSYWMNSYMGGAIPAIGGALLLGALPRILRQPRPRHATLMALGVVILANSRPFEGLVLAVAVAGILVFWILRKSSLGLGVLLPRLVLPAALVLAVGAGATGYYFWRTTGSPLRMPYQENLAHYYPSAVFLWQPEGPRLQYRHKVLDYFYNHWQRGLQPRTLTGIASLTWKKLRVIANFYFSKPLLLAMLGFPWVIANRRLRPLLIVLCAGMAGMGMTIWFLPHYAAPFTAAFLAVALQSLRHLRLWRPHGLRSGLLLARSVPLLCGVTLLACATMGLDRGPVNGDTFLCRRGTGNADRRRVEQQLEALPGRHLVIVRYGPRHSVHQEWVNNHADIDASKVVWAREMDPASDAQLVGYFRDRKTWLLELDDPLVRLSPYSEAPKP